jgi:hypothetical protein
VPIEEAKQVPADRLLAFQEPNEGALATMVVTRDRGIPGVACYLAMTINGTLAARFAAAETATFYVEPGETLLRVGGDPLGRALCGFSEDYWTQRETILRANETKHFRITINGVKADIERSD